MDHMTLGVEEEFFIVDLASGDLAGRSDELVAAARRTLGERSLTSSTAARSRS